MSVETDCQLEWAHVTRYPAPSGANSGFHANDYAIVPITSGRRRVTEPGREAIAPRLSPAGRRGGDPRGARVGGSSRKH